MDSNGLQADCKHFQDDPEGLLMLAWRLKKEGGRLRQDEAGLREIMCGWTILPMVEGISRPPYFLMNFLPFCMTMPL